MAETIFSKILRREIKADVVHEDEVALAFRDIAPQAPVHVLVIPKEPIERLDHALPKHRDVLGHLLWVAAEVARKEGVSGGYRVVINNGEDAGQSVDHLHVHVLGGRRLTWPPG